MNYEQVKFIHEYLVRFFEDSEDPISPPGIKNEETLKSAVARPFMSVGGADAIRANLRLKLLKYIIIIA